MPNLLSKAVIALGVVNAAYLNAASPFIWATPQAGQPALVASDQAASRLAPTGFDQAQGRGQ